MHGSSIVVAMQSCITCSRDSGDSPLPFGPVGDDVRQLGMPHDPEEVPLSVKASNEVQPELQYIHPSGAGLVHLSQKRVDGGGRDAGRHQRPLGEGEGQAGSSWGGRSGGDELPIHHLSCMGKLR